MDMKVAIATKDTEVTMVEEVEEGWEVVEEVNIRDKVTGKVMVGAMHIVMYTITIRYLWLTVITTVSPLFFFLPVFLINFCHANL